MMIEELEQYFTENELLKIYMNISNKEEDIETVLDKNTIRAVNIMKDKYGKDYRMGLMYSQLAHYFTNKYILNVVRREFGNVYKKH